MYKIVVQNGQSFLLGPPYEDGIPSLIAVFMLSQGELAESVCDALNRSAEEFRRAVNNVSNN